MLSHGRMQSFGHAAGCEVDQSTRQALPESTPLQSPIRSALRVCAKAMFSGDIGAPVESGITEDAATSKEP
eukprot:7382847-Prymnesium_polylepis.1